MMFFKCIYALQWNEKAGIASKCHLEAEQINVTLIYTLKNKADSDMERKTVLKANYFN